MTAPDVQLHGRRAASLPPVTAREFRSARVALVGSPEHVEVAQWLLPIASRPQGKIKPPGEAAGAFARIVKEVESRMRDGSVFRETLGQLEAWSTQRPSDDHLRYYEHVRRSDRTPFITLLEASYGKALAILAASWASTDEILEDTLRLLADEDATLKLLAAHVHAHSPHFLGQLVLETELRAFEDADFDATLSSAGASFLMTFGGETKPWLESRHHHFEPLGRDYRGSWWHLPSHIALAMASWA